MRIADGNCGFTVAREVSHEERWRENERSEKGACLRFEEEEEGVEITVE